jgi:hypothetical protein
MTSDQIIEIIYQYFPKGIDFYDRQYLNTVEFKKLTEICFARIDSSKDWSSLLEDLKLEFNVMDYTNLYVFDRCFFAEVSLLNTDFHYFIHVSIICNLFAITDVLGNFVSSGKTKLLKDLVEIHFPNHSLIDLEFANKILPDLSLQRADFGETTIFKLVFADYSL